MRTPLSTRKALAATVGRLPAPKKTPRQQGYLYVIGWSLAQPLWIAHSVSPEKRLGGLQVGNPSALCIVAVGTIRTASVSPSWSAAGRERAIHYLLKDRHLSGEWFNVRLDEVTSLYPKGGGEVGHIEWKTL